MVRLHLLAVICLIAGCDSRAKTPPDAAASPDGPACTTSAECDDGLYCNGFETCAGECEPGTAPVVDDGVACTIDACDEATDAITHSTDDTACDDTLYCNGSETCDAVNDCVAGSPPVLDDGTACTVDACDEATDAITHEPDHGSCGDADPCTDDVCQPGMGCVHPVVCTCTLDAQCDDGNPCTDHACTMGSCVYPGNTAACDDGLYCNGADTCGGGACTVHAGDPCAVGAECANTCTESIDSCATPAGTTCVDDGNPCTDDACDGAGTCGHPANTAPCDDGLYCNGADACGGGACSVHAGNPCSGGPQCNNTCNESADNCLVLAGTACVDTTADCLAAACNGSGACDQAHAPASSGTSCDDALFCTGADTCDGSGGCTTHAGDPCSPNACSETANACLGAPHFTRIVAGNETSCGITAEGLAYCWGQDDYGRLGNGGTSVSTQSPTLVDTAPITGNKVFAQITLGRNHACGLTAEGVAYCWGYDGVGQLGNGGTPVDTQSPSAVNTATIAGNKAFVHLAAGGDHTCGITADGVAYCWGYDASGELGNGGTSVNAHSPSPVSTTSITGNKTFKQLSSGEFYTCGLTVDGVVYCWGNDFYGQLGNGGTGVTTQSPSAVDTGPITGNKAIIQITNGWNHTCALTVEGVAYCWGNDNSGALGNGGTAVNSQSPSPVDTAPITGNNAFVYLTAGASETCGLTGDGMIYCWGYDGFGQLGNGGTSVNTQSPTAVDTASIAGNKVLVELRAGAYHVCGLTADGVAYCWGRDMDGSLGDGGTAVNTQTPSAVDMGPVAGGLGFARLSAGGFHGCGISTDGRVSCWGSDYYGQLGNGPGGDSQSSVAVDTSTITGNTAFVTVAAGEARTCGITAIGAAYCWGLDGSGALGNGAGAGDSQSPSPVDTSTITGNAAMIELAIGRSHTCGLTAAGVVYCWGSDSFGQLGNGGASASTQSPSAVDTSTITGNRAFIHITAGLYHTCGITADGVSYCWGHDGVGELGGGGMSVDTQSPTPIDTTTITGNTVFLHMTAGWDQTCASTATGAAYCWGYDSVGQLGNGGTSVDAQSPTLVDASTIPGNKVFVRFAGGGDHMCGATADGGAACWGDDNLGQLGNGGTGVATQSPSPIDTATISGNTAVLEMTAGFYHSCGITADGGAYCWGNDLDGQLGNGGAGVSTQSPSPVDTSPL